MLDSTFAFDRPLFKRLAHNDTGQAVGHQAGVVIPKDLDSYFPQLSPLVTPTNTAPDITITADLFDGAQFLDTVETRYQFQTWGGTRNPERRITGSLTPLRDLAHAGDILLIERGVTDPNHYRLTLARQGTPLYQTLASGVGTRRWGPLDRADPPSSELQAQQALEEILAREDVPFSPFENDATLVLSKTKRVARSRAFQVRLVDLYGPTCAICGCGLQHPKGILEVEAAHIIPRGLKGADDPRNGLMLCRQHHWALDYGLVGFNDQRRVVVPTAALSIPCNGVLAPLNGRQLRPPSDLALQPSVEAITWHRANILIH